MIEAIAKNTRLQFNGLPEELETPSPLNMRLVHDSFAQNFEQLSGRNCYTITDATSELRMGHISLRPQASDIVDVRVLVGREYRRQGIATIAAKTVCRELFDHHDVNEVRAAPVTGHRVKRFVEQLGATRASSWLYWPIIDWVLTPEGLL